MKPINRSEIGEYRVVDGVIYEITSVTPNLTPYINGKTNQLISIVSYTYGLKKLLDYSEFLTAF